MERITQLEKLQVQVASRQQDFNIVKELESYFLKTSAGKSCSCKLAKVFTRLKKFWYDTGKAELEALNAPVDDDTTNKTISTPTDIIIEETIVEKPKRKRRTNKSKKK